MLFSQALKGYWLDKQLQLTKGTVHNYAYLFNLFQEFIDNKEVEYITATDIKSFLLHLSTERSNSKTSLFNKYQTLSSFFTWFSAEFNLQNPMKKVTKPKVTRKPVKPFTTTELKKLLEAKQSTKLKTIQLLLLDTGLRISELCNLKVEDYDQNNGRLYIKSGKGNKDRIVYLGKRTQKLLWKLTQDKQSGWLFGKTKAPDRNNMLKLIKQLALPLGIKAHPHKYRHTFAIQFLRNGGNIKQLQEILGHSDLKTVELYLELAEIDLEQSRTYSPVDNL